MPIEIVGPDRGSERDAAEALRQLFTPLVGSTQLLIVVGAQCLGEEVQDIDLLLLGSFGRGLSFQGKHGESRGQEIRLVNLCLIVEVKDHPASQVRFESQRVMVYYGKSNYWSDATEQVRRQRLSLKNFLKRHDQPQPWIEGAIWLRNYDGAIPAAAANVLGTNPTALDFLRLMERTKTPQRGDAGFYIAFAKNENVTAIQRASAFFRPIIAPTRLDRRRLEHICKKLIADQKYIDRLGQQLLVFRGRGGSGKTIHLLRLAKDLYDNGKRVLLLTFNKALVADIRRLLVLLGINNQGFDRGIQISTAHKFFIQMLSTWDLWQARGDGVGFPEELYEQRKLELLELLANESPESLSKESVAQNAPEVFAWDYVLVDEGQDWPENERDILYRCFGPQRCIVADGVDQLIRGASPCDWTGPPLARNRQTVPLRRAMRMKSNLCRFIRSFAEEAGGEWDQEVTDEITGGSITIIDGPYTRTLHDGIFQRHREQGNEPIDALFCVPPDALTDPPILPQRLQEWGLSVWDGTSRDVRDTFPTKAGQHRVVRYESCRGLEGWTVACIALDRFFEHRRHHATATQGESLFDTPDDYGHRQATAWTLIPLQARLSRCPKGQQREPAVAGSARRGRPGCSRPAACQSARSTSPSTLLQTGALKQMIQKYPFREIGLKQNLARLPLSRGPRAGRVLVSPPPPGAPGGARPLRLGTRGRRGLYRNGRGFGSACG